MDAPFSPPLFDDEEGDEDDTDCFMQQPCPSTTVTTQPVTPKPAPRPSSNSNSPPIPTPRTSPTTPPQQPQTSTSTKSKPTKRKATEEAPQTVIEETQHLIKTLIASREKKQGSQNYHFGLHVANLLDELPKDVAQKAQIDILQLLYATGNSVEDAA
ncbi:hypothetical protein ElyMa_002464800 [Elysia marginata]|uniref:BESS domain-containing protein n=1 Tax=Elysia marginata TaxID=1093978 RepID=A0AAV4GKQ1_9GAST|nr:hypothetical protein ElyMa_002464800 [Elysia marginata]